MTSTSALSSAETKNNNIRAFEVVLAIPQGLQQDKISVHFAQENDRQSCSNMAYEQEIDTIWKQRISTNSSLFNGTKFRFERVTVMQQESSSTTTTETGEEQHTAENNNNNLTISLGVTDYKSFLGTNCAPHWEQLSPNHLASPLGNAAIVETSDHKVILLKRSGNVGEMPHTIVMPGGHPEPEMVGIHTMKDWDNKQQQQQQQQPDDDDDDNDRSVAHELWDSMIREVVEETGIPRNVLGTPECIGFTRRVQNYRPDIIFFISCNLTADRVHEIYYSLDGPEHKSESTDLLTIDRLEFVKKVIQDNSIHMPGCHRGGVELYRQYLLHRGIMIP